MAAVLKLRPFVSPYRLLVIATLILTLIGSFTAQVNALTLQYAVDSINALLEQGQGLDEGWHILITISAILLGKEVVNALVQFGQKFYGEKLRIFISQDLAQSIIESFKIPAGIFNQDNNKLENYRPGSTAELAPSPDWFRSFLLIFFLYLPVQLSHSD